MRIRSPDGPKSDCHSHPVPLAHFEKLDLAALTQLE